jgi:hypothetical protein
MTTIKEAYERGVADALDLAETVAARLRLSEFKPTRLPFAVDALDEFARAGRELLLRGATGASEPSPAISRTPAEPRALSPVEVALEAIRALPGDRGEINCPTCRGRLHWSRAAENGHVWGRCETEDCVSWIQ